MFKPCFNNKLEYKIENKIENDKKIKLIFKNK